MDSAPAIARPAPALRLNWRVAPTWLVIGLTFLGLALRLVHIGSRPLWLGEASSQRFPARDWHYLWTIVPTYEPHPPFYYSIPKLCPFAFCGWASALRG